jgi:hypothetical protein
MLSGLDLTPKSGHLCFGVRETAHRLGFLPGSLSVERDLNAEKTEKAEIAETRYLS